MGLVRNGIFPFYCFMRSECNKCQYRMVRCLPVHEISEKLLSCETDSYFLTMLEIKTVLCDTAEPRLCIGIFRQHIRKTVNRTVSSVVLGSHEDPDAMQNGKYT